MAKAKHLTRRQLAVLGELFSGELDEQAVLEKYSVGRSLYNRWLADETFAERFDQHIAGAYRQSAALIARYAPLAAAKLVQLTESEKAETARKACVDIISMGTLGERAAGTSAAPTGSEPGQNERLRLSPETASKLLAVLAEQNDER